MVAREGRNLVGRVEKLLLGHVSGHFRYSFVLGLEHRQGFGQELQSFVLDQLKWVRLLENVLTERIQGHLALIEVATKRVSGREGSERV